MQNFIWRCLQIFGKQGVVYLIFFMCTYWLSPYDFGLYNYVLSIIFLLMMFSDFGISTATSKYVAEYNAKKDERLKHLLFNSSLVIVLFSSIVIIFTFFLSESYLGEKLIFIKYLLPLVVLIPLTSLYDGFYRGLGKFKLLSILSSSVGIISLPIAILLVSNFGLIGALVSQVILYSILLIALFLGHKEFKVKLEPSVIKEITKYSFVIGIAGLSYFIFSGINVLILGHYNLIIEVGYYELINKIFAILLVPFSIFAQVISPDITMLHTTKESSKLKRLFKEYTSVTFFVALIFAAIAHYIFPFVLESFFPAYYNNQMIISFNLLLLILVSQCVSTIVSVGFSTASGHAKINMYFLLFFGLINVFLSIVFVNYFGFLGIIYSTILIKCLADITFIYYYYLIMNSNE